MSNSEKQPGEPVKFNLECGDRVIKFETEKTIKKKGVSEGEIYVVILVIVFLFISIYSMIRVFKLENLVKEVGEYIEIGDYDTVRIKTKEILDSSWSSQTKEGWDNMREYLSEMIDGKQVIEEEKIYVDSTNEDFVGKNYLLVVEQLKEKVLQILKQLKEKI